MAMRQSLTLVAAVFGVVYYILEYSGLFRDIPSSTIHILYSFPVLIAALFIFILAGASALSRRKRFKLKDWLGIAGLFLITAGLWTGHFTRFSADVILTEGQSFYSGHGNYLPETIYMGRFAAPPDFGMRLEKIEADLSGGGKEAAGLKAAAVFFHNEKDKKTEHIITGGLPRLIDGTMFSVKDFGYSPRYVLKGKGGRVLDSSFVYMRLFPPGSEGFFRLLSPITYHVRYFPDGKGEATDPVLRLRIVRNKDIVLNRDVKFMEDAEFENSRISFEEIRKWTRLVVKRDWGEVMALAGSCFGVIYIMITCMQFIKMRLMPLGIIKKKEY
jgi:hypothetical protein